jgi:DNA polymerase V
MSGALNETQLGNLGVAIHAGFPNAALGSHAQSLDLTTLLVKHPSTTFFMRLDNNQWTEQGMFKGDLVIVDRSVNPQLFDMVIWCDADQFTMTPLKDVPADIAIWGTVRSVIHQLVKE